MGKIGAMEWLVILAILLLLFGAAKLPAIGKGLGEGIKNFKKALSSETEDEGKGSENKGDKKH